MSVFRVASSFLSLKPQVYGGDDVLYCESSLFSLMSSLWGYHRLVVVDGRNRLITIERRTWWGRKPRFEVPFEAIERIEYDFGAIPIPFFFVLSLFKIIGIVDAERFSVLLHLKAEAEPIRLAWFDGLDWKPFTDVDLDLLGEQADASRVFVSELKRMLGVPVGPPLPPGAEAWGVLRHEGPR